MSENTRTLSVGDVIAANPCVVSIDRFARTVAYGNCQTCQTGHAIDAARYEAGLGPWHPAEPDNPNVTVSSLSRRDLLLVLDAWFKADFGDRDACLAAERLAARLGLEAAQETT